MLYYRGLPSNPRLIARTGFTWEAPTGPEAYPRRRELRIVGNHKIVEVWEGNLALKVHGILDQNGVDWSSTDVVRTAYEEVPSPYGDVIIWIGVKPGSLPYDVGIDVAIRCKRLLLEYGIDDVDVEIRQSEIIQSAGPQLLQPTTDRHSDMTNNIDPMVDVHEPFSTALGIPICAESTPGTEGTGGFFLEVDDPQKLFLVTARHVVFPQSDNDLFERTSENQPRHNVLVFSEASLQKHLAFIKDRIRQVDFSIDIETRRVDRVAGREDARAIEERKDGQKELGRAKESATALPDFHQELSTHWATDSSRILGHVIFSPPIAVGTGTEQYTQDVAVIEIDSSKIEPSSFIGNIINLGKFSVDLIHKIHPNEFKFPLDRLLKLRGTIAVDEIRRPTMYDEHGQPCIMVLKRGRTTGLTVGRSNNVLSYTRKRYGDGAPRVSMQWAILPFDEKSGPFSAKGDSGSVVVDGAGRIGGLLTGGGGSRDEDMDVAYVTPIDFVLGIIHGNESLAKASLKSVPPGWERWRW
jgi:hypothetical protein